MVTCIDDDHVVLMGISEPAPVLDKQQQSPCPTPEAAGASKAKENSLLRPH